VKRASQSDFAVRFHFHESLRYFLPKTTVVTRRDMLPHVPGRAEGPSRGSLGKILHEKTSIKDAIESCGVPHPEVNLILIDGTPVDFAFQLDREYKVEIFGFHDYPERFQNERLQERTMSRFVADGHLGKLVRFLRLLGIDVAYDRSADDRKLLEIAVDEKRALLTRDRRLLMHSIVQHGYYPRSQMPDEQALEVVRRFDLFGASAAYSRCLHCNAMLDSVPKSEVFAQLEPLTQIYYEDFWRCAGCGKIYWAGSHFPKLQERIEALRAKL
jgi:uncharacterized protein